MDLLWPIDQHQTAVHSQPLLLPTWCSQCPSRKRRFPCLFDLLNLVKKQSGTKFSEDPYTFLEAFSCFFTDSSTKTYQKPPLISRLWAGWAPSNICGDPPREPMRSPLRNCPSERPAETERVLRWGWAKEPPGGLPKPLRKTRSFFLEAKNFGQNNDLLEFQSEFKKIATHFSEWCNLFAVILSSGPPETCTHFYREICPSLDNCFSNP